VNNNPLLKFKNPDSGSSSGDAFLIAAAAVYGLTILSEEKKKAMGKIPYIANKLGLQTVNINELCEQEKWTF